MRFVASSTKEFIEWFETKSRAYDTHDYWLEPILNEKEYTGYNEELKDQTYLRLEKDEIESLNIPTQCKSNVEHKDAKVFRIRLYEKGQRLFPVGLKAFRVSFCQYAVNFPPLTAKYLYERYTDHIKTQEQINIYDPSSGWGGRLLGALSVNDERNIHYIGTDPNTDHNTLKEERSITNSQTSSIQKRIALWVCFLRLIPMKSFSTVQKKFIKTLTFKSIKVSWT
jgi:hypothetical protein